ncbi:RING finger protein-like [Tropilaelaps mercedesae]|uniref:RING-type E3 ubiquitin transferase n=1 Tax=Tropilaelaps mercedesae TaxID=418985 RepID=A0A1V9XXU6_9ACAR|nr:RING finger protein-like [Tropilaelaps mercedesae]
MGVYLSRQNGLADGEDINSSSVYRYPPKSGNYFASHFIMGGERFDASQPEAYLFGENSDLNFLASRPLPFPYPAPQPNEPTRPLRCLINIRKESLRFVRVKTGSSSSSDASTKKCCSSDECCFGGPSPGSAGTAGPNSTRYNIEFIFDTECRCAITIHYFCTEEVTSNGLVYAPRFPTMSSETYHYKRGCNQLFQQSSHVFDPSQYSDAELAFNNNYTMFLADIQRCERAVDGIGIGVGGGIVANGGSGGSPNGGPSLSGFGNGIGGGGCDAGGAGEVFPVVIHCVAEEGEEPRQSHVLLAVVERASSSMLGSSGDSGVGISQPTGSSYTLKPLKQKLFVDGLVYLLQEIYGIENKNNICNNSSIHIACSHNSGCAHSVNHNDDCGSLDGVGLRGDSDSEEEAGGECVICMSEPRDTLILPCRHLCLCAACADSLRYQANNCPICRAPFRALLQIRAVRKMLLSSHPSAHLNNEHQLHQVGQDVPAGYESIPLLEALNGPPMGGGQAILTSQIAQPGKHVRLHTNGSSANPSHSPRGSHQQSGGSRRSGSGSVAASGGGGTGGGKMGKMYRNKSSSAGSLRHQQQQHLQAHSSPRSAGQVAPVGGTHSVNGADSTGEESAVAVGGDTQPVARAETAPPPSRHRRHKEKAQGQQLQQQGKGIGKALRPQTANVNATSLAAENLSAERKSLLDGENDGTVVGDATVTGTVTDGDLGTHNTFPPTGSPSPAAATVITVDQATDTSLDNRDLHGSREDTRDMDMLFHRRKAFPDLGYTGRAGSESESADLELVEQREASRTITVSALDDPDGGELPPLPPDTPESGSARSSAESFSSAGSATRLLVNATEASSATGSGMGGHPTVTVVTIKQQKVGPTCADTEEV